MITNRKVKKSMEYHIENLSHFYFDKGIQMGDDIQRALSKCDIVILCKTHFSIEFTPWSISDPRIDDNISGYIFWNPITDVINIQYSLHLPFSAANNKAYSRCLKWYLYKWNENRTKAYQKMGVCFIYPGADGTEILLQAKFKASSHRSKNRIRKFLLQLNDIIEAERDTIISILLGSPPVEFRNEIFEEIINIISEMKT